MRHRLAPFLFLALTVIGTSGLIMGFTRFARASTANCYWKVSRQYQPSTGTYIWRDDGGCMETDCDNATACTAQIHQIGSQFQVCRCGSEDPFSCAAGFNGPDLSPGQFDCFNISCAFACSAISLEPEDPVTHWERMGCSCQ